MTDRIFETGFDYVISNCDVWLPGSYDSRAAAQLALDNKSLQDWKFLEGLREDINIKQQRRITEEDIRLALCNLEKVMELMTPEKFVEKYGELAAKEVISHKFFYREGYYCHIYKNGGLTISATYSDRPNIKNAEWIKLSELEDFLNGDNKNG